MDGGGDVDKAQTLFRYQTYVSQVAHENLFSTDPFLNPVQKSAWSGPTEYKTVCIHPEVDPVPLMKLGLRQRVLTLVYSKDLSHIHFFVLGINTSLLY